MQAPLPREGSEQLRLYKAGQEAGGIQKVLSSKPECCKGVVPCLDSVSLELGRAWQGQRTWGSQAVGASLEVEVVPQGGLGSHIWWLVHWLSPHWAASAPILSIPVWSLRGRLGSLTAWWHI